MTPDFAPDSPPEASRTSLRLVAMATLGLWAVCAFLQWRGHWANDLAALWFAGHFLAEARPDLVYAAPQDFFGGTAPHWQAYLAQVTQDPGNQAFPYIYPPLWAGLVAPLTRIMQPQAFFDIVLAVHLAMMAGSVLLAERLARPATMPFALFIGWGVAVLALSVPAVSCAFLNQPTVCATFLTLLAFHLAPFAPRRAGLALALAAALKITPAVFVLLFVLRGRHRAALSFALCGAGLALASLSFGWPLHADFLAQMKAASAHSVWAQMNPSPRILALFLADRFGLSGPGGLLESAGLIKDPQQHFVLIFLPQWVGRLAAGLALLLVLPAGGLALTRQGRGADALALLGLSVGLFLLGPLSWQHYLLGPLLLAPALLHGLPQRTGWAVLAALFIASSQLLLQTLAPLDSSLLTLTVTATLAWGTVLALSLVALSRQPRRN